MQELDEYDKKLLRQLQQNNKITAEELGLLVNLSTSAVQRRLRRLRDDKMIEADFYHLTQSGGYRYHLCGRCNFGSR
jgi:predicted transcriptional regulator